MLIDVRRAEQHNRDGALNMELYFKDLEDEAGASPVAGPDCEGMSVSQETAEEDAFAELSDRVSAARLIY